MSGRPFEIDIGPKRPFRRAAAVSRAIGARSLWPWFAAGLATGAILTVAVIGGLLQARWGLVGAERLDDEIRRRADPSWLEQRAAFVRAMRDARTRRETEDASA